MVCAVGGLLCFLLVAATHHASSLPPSLFLGIAPQDEEYFAPDVISCRDGSKSFSKDRLNDGFCDCPDGTDEPGTSACPESRFYCRNLGDTPRVLYSSRVNDHICDCCDGSDEYDGHKTCPNTCLEIESVLNRSDGHIAGGRSSMFIYGQEKGNTDDVLIPTELKVGAVVQWLVATRSDFCFYSTLACKS